MNHDGNTKKRVTDRPVFWAAISLLLALLIWVYYGLNYGTEMTRTLYGVEVTYAGREAMRDSLGLIISREETTSVNVTLTGSRRDIARLTNADLKAVVNLANVTSAGYRTMGYTITYPTTVNSSSIQESKQPQTVGLQISKVSSTYVDVRGRFEGTLQDGYVIDSSGMIYEPASIYLQGPEEELSQVAYAGVAIDRDDVNASFSTNANVFLVDENGQALEFDDVTMDAQTVSVTVPVNMMKEVPLTVTLVDGGGATEANVQYEVNPPSVTLAGDASILNAISSISVATIELAKYDTFPMTAFYIVTPNETENLSGETTAQVSLNFFGLETAEYTVTNLGYTNLPAGYSAAIRENWLSVKIRATPEVLSQIAANNIRAVADLTDVTANARVPVTITVDGFPEAGAVGDYAIYVRVTPSESEEAQP